jgi:hypothetical protein
MDMILHGLGTLILARLPGMPDVNALLAHISQGD